MDERGVKPQRPRKYSEIFDEQFSFYLSIGMSSEEYWDGDVFLPKYYRKAYKMRQESINQEAWLHGLYVYDAVVSALSHLSPKKSSHKEFAEKPYSFNKQKSEEEAVTEAQARAEVWMKNWASATQKMFSKK